MVTARFDEPIHPSTRLSLVVHSSTDWADFVLLRDRLGLSDSALSKQLAALEQAGYVGMELPVTDHRRRVRARLTDAGRRAFDGHVAALQELISAAEPATG